MSEQDKPVNKVVRLAYAGKRLNDRGAARYCWVDTSDLQGQMLVYSKRMVNVSIGGIATFEATDDMALSHGAPTLDRIDDDTAVARWYAADEVAERAARVRSIERKSTNVEPLEVLLAQIKTLTQNLTWPEKRALAARIMEEVFGW